MITFVFFILFKTQIEIIPVLRAQLESYKSDFDDEREARTRMSEKNDVLVNDLKKLQKMHTDLLENLNQQDCVMIIPHQDQHQYQHQNQHQHQSSASGGVKIILYLFFIPFLCNSVLLYFLITQTAGYVLGSPLITT